MENKEGKKEKESEKEFKERTDESYSQKADELKFNDKIDDAYTNKLVDKYEKGHKKNLWFVASGLLSIIFGFLAIIITVIVASTYGVKGVRGSYDLDENKTKLLTISLVMIIYGLCSLAIGAKIATLANYTREMLMKKTSYIVVLAILQLFLGGVIFSIFTLVGYFVGRGIDYGAIYYNKIEGYNKNNRPKSEDLETELQILKSDENVNSDQDIYLYHNQNKNI